MLKIHIARMLAAGRAAYATLRKPAEWGPWVPVIGVLMYMPSKSREELETGNEKWIKYHLKCILVMMIVLAIIWVKLVIQLHLLQQRLPI